MDIKGDTMAAIISVVFGFIELVVGLRFFFRLLGANPDSTIVSWVYHVSAPLVTPFAGIFGQPLTTEGVVVASVFEISALIALIVYAAIAGLLLQLFYSYHHHHTMTD
jgi:hypothetical protein